MIKELILGEFPENPSEGAIPLGPWCFSGIEEKHPEWEESYSFPRMFENISEKEEFYHYCVNIFHTVLPEIVKKYREKIGRCLNDLSDATLAYFLIPHLFRTISFGLGRARYIEKFMITQKGEKFKTKVPIKPLLLNNTQHFYKYGRNFHIWLNYKILQHFNSETVEFEENLILEQENRPSRTINSFDESKKQIQRIYGMGRPQSLILNLLLKLKPACYAQKPLQDLQSSFQYLKPIKKTIQDQDLQFVQKLFFEALPLSMSEDLKLHKENALKHLSAFIKISGKFLFDQVTINDDQRRLFHAYWLEKGGRLGHAQHGGIYESNLNHWVSECFEFLADYFITWGWGLREKSSPRAEFIPLPSLVLSRIKNKHREKNDTIFYVSSHVNSCNDGICYQEPYDALQYRKIKYAFFSQLTPNVLKKIYYKPMTKHVETSLENYDYILKKGFKIPEIAGHLMTQALNARLMVVDYYGTTFLECLACNIPVVLLLAEHEHIFTPQIQKYMELFKKMGIVHDTPETAAKLINEHYTSIKEWWQNPELQNLRKEFCKKFCLATRYPLISWVRAIWNLR